MNIYLLYDFGKGAKGAPRCCANAQAVVNYLSRFFHHEQGWKVSYKTNVAKENLAKAIDELLDGQTESHGVILMCPYEKTEKSNMDDDGMKYIAELMNQSEPPKFIVFRKQVIE